MIGITFALPSESSDLITALGDKDKGGLRGIWFGSIHGKRVGIAHTGVGETSCGLKIDELLEALNPDVLISTGFAGGVDSVLQVGDIILGKNFSDPEILLQAQRAIPQAKSVTLFTEAKILDSEAERKASAQSKGAEAVDMETAVISRACAKRGLPMLSLRIISDSLDQPLPVSPNLLFDVEWQRTDFARLGLYLLTHPLRIGPFVRFAQRITRVRQTLTNAIVALVKAI